MESLVHTFTYDPWKILAPAVALALALLYACIPPGFARRGRRRAEEQRRAAEAKSVEQSAHLHRELVLLTQESLRARESMLTMYEHSQARNEELVDAILRLLQIAIKKLPSAGRPNLPAGPCTSQPPAPGDAAAGLRPRSAGPEPEPEEPEDEEPVECYLRLGRGKKRPAPGEEEAEEAEEAEEEEEEEEDPLSALSEEETP